MAQSSRLERALALFQPDAEGNSDWVAVTRFADAGLTWTKNGNLRRGAPWELQQFHWEVQRGPGRVVLALRMAGHNLETAFSQSIDASVRQHFENQTNCNFSLLPIPEPDREIDHRYGHKSHADYVALYEPGNQSPSDFQLIHRVLNLQKRQMCNDCVATGVRPRHPEFGFLEGDATHTGRFPCKGCYLAEPDRYRIVLLKVRRAHPETEEL